jgi:hypothetical protein
LTKLLNRFIINKGKSIQELKNMKLRSLVNHIILEGFKETKDKKIKVFEPALVSPADGEKYSGGRKLHSNLTNALNHNGKVMFYAFDLTNRCNRGCPGCYVDRGKEIACNAVKDVPIKEYKGDLRKWEDWASKSPANKQKLDDAKKQTNDNGGIRMFSAADYPDATDAEYVKILKDAKISDTNFFKNNVTAFLDDAKATGWHVKAITKELNFLKDHIDHPALHGVDVSMNAQGFGESHEVVKALRSGKHNHKNLSDAEKVKLGTKFDSKDAKRLAQHANKIIGRTVTHTPFDLTKILEHKDDHSHIGVITSGHDIPGNGIRYVPSKPKQPFSPKTIIMQVNFPDTLKHILDGDVKTPSLSEVASALNEYADKYNKLRDIASAALRKGTINVLDVKDQNPLAEAKAPEPDVDTTEEDGGETITDTPVKKGKTEKVARHSLTTTLHRENGKWMQYVYKSSNGTRQEAKANLIPNIEEQFDIINPEFTYKFTEQDAKFLLQKMQGKMCCAGEDDEGQAAGGKCHHCKAKCGVQGCGSNVKQKDPVNIRGDADDQTDTLKDHIEGSRFLNLL